jgi:hypothetical protein
VAVECDTGKGYQAVGTPKATACTSSGPYTVSGCQAIVCQANEYVLDFRCFPCKRGSTRPAGDKATDGNTKCASIICGAKQHVVFNQCKDCPAGTDFTKHKGLEPADGPSTSCLAGLCGEGQYVNSNHQCVQCGPGYTNAVGDDSTGPPTTCDKLMCPVDHRVRSNKCEPCPAETIYATNADASGPDTECVALPKRRTCDQLYDLKFFKYIKSGGGASYARGSGTKCGIRAFRAVEDPSESVCTGYDNPDYRKSQGIKYAVKLDDWRAAFAFCKGQGMRLCTDAETPYVAQSAGCGYDTNVMWTDTACTAKDGTKGHIVDVGHASNSRASAQLKRITDKAVVGTSRCVSDNESFETLGEAISVQCCGDPN